MDSQSLQENVSEYWNTIQTIQKNVILTLSYDYEETTGGNTSLRLKNSTLSITQILEEWRSQVQAQLLYKVGQMLNLYWFPIVILVGIPGNSCCHS